MSRKPEGAHARVRSTYGEIARVDGPDAACCRPESPYAPDEIDAIPEGAELGLGTGNPVAAASPEPGETVVDLGSGPGVDVFLAAEAVGASGRAIGVDLTPEMVDRARALADEAGVENVRFVHSPIEDVPLPDGVADVVVSNCVINLTDDEHDALAEAARLLAPGGRLVVSDTLRVPSGAKAEATGPGCGCSSGALTASEWRAALKETGFTRIEMEPEPPDGRFGPEVGTVLVRARKPR